MRSTNSHEFTAEVSPPVLTGVSRKQARDHEKNLLRSTRLRSTRARSPQAGSRKSAKSVLVKTGMALALLASVAAVVAGLTGFGQEPVQVPAPQIPTPFSAEDPNGFSGIDVVPDLGPNELAIPSLKIRISLVPAVPGPDPSSTGGGEQLVLPDAPAAGLYTQGAPIGSSAGTALVAGHVNFANGDFSPLSKITEAVKGTPVYATNSTGILSRYEIQSGQTYLKQRLPETFFTKDGDPQLAIVTCGGNITYPNGYAVFDSNTTITATPTTAVPTPMTSGTENPS